jgi:excisionase family DNA binding protein
MKRENTEISPEPPPQLLLTIPQLCTVLGLGRTKVYELIASEGLPTVKLGHGRRVQVKSLQRWLDERERQDIA